MPKNNDPQVQMVRDTFAKELRIQRKLFQLAGAHNYSKYVREIAWLNTQKRITEVLIVC